MDQAQRDFDRWTSAGREQMIDMAVRRQLNPQWRRYFDKYPNDLPEQLFRDTDRTALTSIRLEFAEISGRAV